jgi:hypothetical protein
MSDEPREFTVDEANALVPTLHRIVSRQMLVLEELERELERIHKSTGVMPREFEPRPGDGPEVVEMKGKVCELIDRFAGASAKSASLTTTALTKGSRGVNPLGLPGRRATSCSASLQPSPPPSGWAQMTARAPRRGAPEPRAASSRSRQAAATMHHAADHGHQGH